MTDVTETPIKFPEIDALFQDKKLEITVRADSQAIDLKSSCPLRCEYYEPLSRLVYHGFNRRDQHTDTSITVLCKSLVDLEELGRALQVTYENLGFTVELYKQNSKQKPTIISQTYKVPALLNVLLTENYYTCALGTPKQWRQYIIEQGKELSDEIGKPISFDRAKSHAISDLKIRIVNSIREVTDNLSGPEIWCEDE